MRLWLKVLIVTILFGAPTLPLGNLWWPPAEMGASPTSLQFGLLIGVGVVEAIAFGLGVAFIIFGWNIVKNSLSRHKHLAQWMYVSIAWSLVSWWLHDRLHMHYGFSIKPLIAIEYGFHLTLIVAALIVAYGFIKIIREPANVNQ